MAGGEVAGGVDERAAVEALEHGGERVRHVREPRHVAVGERAAHELGAAAYAIKAARLDTDDELRFQSPDTGDIADGGAGIDLLRIDYSAIISNNIFFTLGPTTNVKVDEALTVG